MSESKVLFEEHGKVAVIKINRPEKRNALDRETVLMINDCTEKISSSQPSAQSAFFMVPLSFNGVQS